jgi:hypothetical protein
MNSIRILVIICGIAPSGSVHCDILCWASVCTVTHITKWVCR